MHLAGGFTPNHPYNHYSGSSADEGLCPMTTLQRIALSLLALCFLFSGPAYAEGPLRERMKERFKDRLAEKLEEQPAPQATASLAAPLEKPGDHYFSLKHNGLMRHYRVHVPPTYNPAQKTALVIAFHGGGGDMDYMARNEYYGLLSKADQEGDIIVFPNGYSRFPSGKLATWNAGDCCGDARDKQIDDVGFVKEIVGNLNRQMNIDNNRIFAIGMSNGGMMAYRLACELPEIFAAVVSVAGTDNTKSCHPSRTVSILHIHAQNDTHVLFGGGAGPGSFRDESKVTDFVSVPQTIKNWTTHNQCQGIPERILNVKGAYCDLYNNCNQQSRVQLCVTEAGGHSWPGGHKPRGETPSRALSANDVIWDFFRRL